MCASAPARATASACWRTIKNLYDHTSPFQTVEMKPILNDGVVTLYEGELQVPERHFKYWFELRSKDETLHYTSDGFLENVQERNCFYCPVINSDDIIAPPEWAKGGIVYQIFVDRFYNGEPANDPAGTVSPDVLPRNGTFYGGDLQGAAERLDYVKALGAEMVYLSPVLKSPTYHKYDVADYYAVDESLGGNQALTAFVKTSAPTWAQGHSRRGVQPLQRSKPAVSGCSGKRRALAVRQVVLSRRFPRLHRTLQLRYVCRRGAFHAAV